MQKVLLTIGTMFLLFSTGCEKEMKLSEFVIGEWESQEIMLDGTTLVTFLVDIEESNYILTLTDGTNTITLEPKGYTVDNELNEISIEQPVFDSGAAKSGDPIMITFSVTWLEKGSVMTWTPKSDETGAPVIVWTKSTDR